MLTQKRSKLNYVLDTLQAGLINGENQTPATFCCSSHPVLQINDHQSKASDSEFEETQQVRNI